MRMLRTSSGLTADFMAEGRFRICDAQHHCHVVNTRQTAYRVVATAEMRGISLDAALQDSQSGSAGDPQQRSVS
ncbi:MAG: hypothetical protein ACON4T_07225 [Synechococcus sp.]